MNDIVIFESANQPVQVRLEGETVWLSQAHMAELFDVQKAAVSKHLKNIFASGELQAQATVSKLETVQQEGTRTVSRQVEHDNLDAIISVGYRVNSTRSTRLAPMGHRRAAPASGRGRYPQPAPAEGTRHRVRAGAEAALAHSGQPKEPMLRLVEHFVLLADETG